MLGASEWLANATGGGDLLAFSVTAVCLSCLIPYSFASRSRSAKDVAPLRPI